MEKGKTEKSISSVTPVNGSERKNLSPVLHPNAYDEIRSRYMKSPVSSCHDLCKFGHKHGHGDQKFVVFERFMEHSIASDIVQSHGVRDGRKISRVKKFTEIRPISRVSANFFQQTSLHHESLLAEMNDMKNLNANTKKTMGKQSMKLKALLAPACFLNKQRNSMDSTVISAAGGSNVFKKKIVSPATKLNRKVSEKQKPSSLLSLEIDGSSKPVISLRIVRSEAHMNANVNIESSRSLKIASDRSPKVLKSGGKDLLKHQRAFIHPSTPHPSVASFKVRKSRNHTKQGRDEYIVSKDNETIGAKSENEVNISEVENFSEEYDEILSKSCVGNAKMNQSCKLSVKVENKRARKIPFLRPIDSSPSPHLMKFRRGRVIHDRTMENTIPKRLRFRRGRALDDNSGAECIKKVLRKHEPGNTKAHAAHSASSHVVLLKHRDSCVRKETRALLNHVIEETASKLVETKKSKVKALVGAFETVISLHETKTVLLV